MRHHIGNSFLVRFMHRAHASQKNEQKFRPHLANFSIFREFRPIMSTNGCAIILGTVSLVALRRVVIQLRKMSKIPARTWPILAYFANPAQ